MRISPTPGETGKAWSAVVVGCALSVACPACRGQPVATTDPADSCPTSGAEAIVSGSGQESYLGIGPEQLAAIVQVVDRTSLPQDGGPLCSAFFVTPDWAATAAHCLQIPSAAIVVPKTNAHPSELLPVVDRVRHPSLDIALLRVADSDGGARSDVVPIPVSSAAPNLTVGDGVEIAGYGLTDPQSQSVGNLNFVVEAIEEVAADAITVNGFGVTGACEGDSGGPLLVRGGDGRIEAAGILSDGSETCTGEDTYLRLDPVSSWVQSVTGEAFTTDDACGGISGVGRCFGDAAVWCTAGVIAGSECAVGSGCGWDPTASGFRCVSAMTDPCRGVDAVGGCRGNVALRCPAGNLESDDCGCRPCHLDGVTGAPSCEP